MEGERKISILVLFLVLGVVIMSMTISCDTETNYPVTKVEKKDYSASDVNRIEISNTSGDVKVEKWDIDTIEIEAIKKTWFESDMDYIKVDIDKGSTFEVKTVYENVFINGSVDFKIKIPANIEVEVVSTSGDINIDGITGLDKVEATSGDIDIKNTDYIRKVIATSGDIDVEINGMKKNVSIIATSGDVNLDVKKDIYKDLDIEVTSGDIDRNGAASQGNGEYDINIKVTSGDVNIREM